MLRIRHINQTAKWIFARNYYCWQNKRLAFRKKSGLTEAGKRMTCVLLLSIDTSVIYHLITSAS